MNKKILAIYYSQSGQLKEMIDCFCEPLIQAGATVEKVQIKLVDDFTFPWTTERFFSVMPDCVMAVPREIVPFQLQQTSYDLIILGYQAWFLSLSIPFNSLMHHPTFLQVIKNTPVITITGARNMWTSAYDKMRPLLKASGAKHVGNISLVDRHLNLVSIFTIFHWLVGGKKDRYLGFFPLPGVSDEDIQRNKAFGQLALQHIQHDDWNSYQSELVQAKAVDPKFHLIFIEGKAAVMFKLWARLIVTRKKRGFWLAAFKYYLLIALFIAAPLVYIIDIVIFKVFLSRYVKAKREFYLKLN